MGEFNDASALLGHRMAPVEAAAEFQKMDRNGDGVVVFDAFCVWSAHRELGPGFVAADETTIDDIYALGQPAGRGRKSASRQHPRSRSPEVPMEVVQRLVRASSEPGMGPVPEGSAARRSSRERRPSFWELQMTLVQVATKTLPLPCVSTVFVTKTLPLPCGASTSAPSCRTRPSSPRTLWYRRRFPSARHR